MRTLLIFNRGATTVKDTWSERCDRWSELQNTKTSSSQSSASLQSFADNLTLEGPSDEGSEHGHAYGTADHGHADGTVWHSNSTNVSRDQGGAMQVLESSRQPIA
jgi:hypothetical protein